MTVNHDTAIQARVLRILRVFDEFSKKNGIEYYALGGTLLGAVRHGGFIPWDDDIDIGVPREDYDRLAILAKEFPFPYRLESFELYPEFIYPFTKLYDTSTTVTEDFIKPFRRGLWIDIFPLDGSFGNKYLRLAHYKSIDYLKRKIATNNGSHLSNKYHREKTVAQKLVETIWQLVPRSILYGTLRRLLKMRAFGHASYVGNLLGRWGGNREIMLKNIISAPRAVLFCGMEIPAPNNPDVYLRNIYGDYMTPPPEERRSSSHQFLEVNLDHSYLEPTDK